MSTCTTYNRAHLFDSVDNSTCSFPVILKKKYANSWNQPWTCKVVKYCSAIKKETVDAGRLILD